MCLFIVVVLEVFTATTSTGTVSASSNFQTPALHNDLVKELWSTAFVGKSAGLLNVLISHASTIFAFTNS